MTDLTIRPAYSKWPDYNRALRDVVAGLTDEPLAMCPSHDVYHAAELNETLGVAGLPLIDFWD
jgi:hypothetical protein